MGGWKTKVNNYDPDKMSFFMKYFSCTCTKYENCQDPHMSYEDQILPALSSQNEARGVSASEI